MSLQVWLPLNGNLNNQGLSDITVTNNGATVDNSGKIGKCYKCSGDARISFQSFSWMTMKPQNNFSFFFWVKGTTTGWLFACSAWEFRLTPTYIQIHLAGNGQYPARYNGSFDTNTWYHLGFTWSGSDGKLLLYLNGSKVAESDVPSSANFDIASTFNLPYDGPRYLNDVRIYDHCLSKKEVKEISKGLVLHYRLAGPGQENLLSRYVAPGFGSPNSTSADGRTIYYGDYGIKIPASENADTYFNLYLSKQLIQGNIYTISCEVENLLNGTSYSFPLFTQGNTSMGVLKLDHNGLCSLTFTMNGSSQSSFTASSGETVYRCFMDDSARSITSGQSNTPIIIKNFKIEEGSIVTPWCPNPADPLYSTLGYDNNIEYDCSGYHRNGTKSGMITWDVDSPRYTTSYHFSSSQYINYTENFTFLTTGSISFWAKFNTKGSYGWLPFTGQSTSYYIMATSSGSGNFYNENISAAGTIKYYEDNKSVLAPTNDGKWHHYVITGINMSAWTAFKINNYSSGWNSDVNYADVRIYNTILSAEDIAELYHSAVIVDNTGKNYAYEYFEAN